MRRATLVLCAATLAGAAHAQTTPVFTQEMVDKGRWAWIGGGRQLTASAGIRRVRSSTSMSSTSAAVRPCSSPYDAIARAYQWPHSYSLKGLRTRPS